MVVLILQHSGKKYGSHSSKFARRYGRCAGKSIRWTTFGLEFQSCRRPTRNEMRAGVCTSMRQALSTGTVAPSNNHHHFSPSSPSFFAKPSVSSHPAHLTQPTMSTTKETTTTAPSDSTKPSPVETAQWVNYLPEAFGIQEAVRQSPFRWCVRESSMWGIATGSTMAL